VSGSLHRLERYRSVVPEWEAFLEANLAPEPVTLRVRRALVDRDQVAERLRARGFGVEPVPGLDDYLRVEEGPGSVAQTLEHWLGHFHVQQAVMALPALALGPAPGERILDLCAAPGGKTAHLAELMQDIGPLVAVDPREKRLRGLMANVFRLGHPGVIVVAADGRELPEGARFDRVLVDVPCSAEGNFRRQQGRLPGKTAAFQRYIGSLQEALLRSAIRLTRPGGSVVYATCTFAPEENEAVLDRVLRDPPAEVELEPIALPFPHEPGLPEWQGTRFLPDISRAWRVYPQHLDSGGLFMARLRRTDEPAEEAEVGWSRVPAAFPGEDEAAARSRIEGAMELLSADYGFRFDDAPPLGWMVRKENIWVQTAGDWPVEAWRRHGGWRVVSTGLRAFRAAGAGRETPSNQFLSRFHRALGEGRRRDLDREELRTLLRDEALDPGELPAGPVVLFHEGTLLGRGMVGRSGLRHEIPSAQAKRLRVVLGL
jgi:NOL1/NOP2/sun family putative RNA methylase